MYLNLIYIACIHCEKLHNFNFSFQDAVTDKTGSSFSTLDVTGVVRSPAKNIFEIYFLNLNPKIFFTADKINLSVKISTTTLIIYWAKLIYFQSKFSDFFTLFIQRILSPFKPHVRLLST